LDLIATERMYARVRVALQAQDGRRQRGERWLPRSPASHVERAASRMASREADERAKASHGAIVLAVVDLERPRHFDLHYLGPRGCLDSSSFERSGELGERVLSRGEAVSHEHDPRRDSKFAFPLSLRLVGKRQPRQLLGGQHRVERKIAAALETPGSWRARTTDTAAP
jgi:hypothetical protein